MNRDAWAAPHVQRLFDSGSLCGLTEWELLNLFALRRDQAAFEVLVARHGPMVLGVCRRILGDPNDVDDAFQATFLVLVRRAASLGPSDVVAAWLHGVALKVALRARSRRDRRNRRERSTEGVEPADAAPGPDEDFALRAVIDEEVDRLPWKYKAPVALCYFEGLTHEEAARRLGWPIGTVKGRLARARAVLGSRLSRRGINSAAGAGAVAVATILNASIQAAPPESLVAAAARASARIADGRAWDAVASTSVAELVRGVFTAMFLNKLKSVAALMVVSGVAITGAGVYGRQPLPGAKLEDPSPPVYSSKSAPRTTPDPEDVEPPPPPAEAGSTRSIPEARKDSVDQLQKKLLVDAARVFQVALEDYRHGRVSADRVYRASRFQLDAQLQAAKETDDRINAYEKHLKRILALGGTTLRAAVDSSTSRTMQDEVRAFQAEADLWLARSREGAKRRSEDVDSNGPADDPNRQATPATRAILAKLEEPVAMNFPNETPLEDLLRYVKQATQGPADGGIPIYVDPFGLMEAERTISSPVSIDLEGVPLRRTLQLALIQLGLVYFVDDGLLVITSISSEQSTLPPSFAKPLTLTEMRLKAQRGEMDVDEMKTLIEKLKLIKELKAVDADVPREVERTPETATAPSGRADSASIEQLKASTEQIRTLIDQMRALTEVLNPKREPVPKDRAQ